MEQQAERLHARFDDGDAPGWRHVLGARTVPIGFFFASWSFPQAFGRANRDAFAQSSTSSRRKIRRSACDLSKLPSRKKRLAPRDGSSATCRSGSKNVGANRFACLSANVPAAVCTWQRKSSPCARFPRFGGTCAAP